ncbi:MAG TPA: DUF4263 domain-containing protein [Bacteroidales bacterium]|nr:MAG: Uncharacterized protein XD98_0381 [Microgenomates bacterium 39_6]HAL64291.1 DUF4263 domain-containing protein [Bacteroidales bacterium]
MQKYQLTRVSANVATTDDVVIEESGTFRKIFRGVVIKDNPKDPKATLKGYIIVQRKSANDEWQDLSSVKLTELKKDEGIKFELKSLALKNLFEALVNLYSISEQELPWLKEIYVVAKEDEIIRVDEKRKNFVTKLLEQDYGNEVWEQLVQKEPHLATRLAYSRVQTERQTALREFESSLTENKDEAYWQNFFKNNEWIFGLGLRYQYLHLITSQPQYGGGNVFGSGSQRGDYLMDTAADGRFTVLVEIKKPSTDLLGNEEYRNGAWEIGKDLVGGVSQLQVNANKWEVEGSRTDENREELDGITTCSPKGLLVIGHCNQLNSNSKKKTFELYRRNLTNPEIITFDELYERAKFIVNNSAEEVQPQTEVVASFEVELEDDKIPF